MAYNLGDRFLPPPKCIRLSDPGAYEKEVHVTKPNKVPFLSLTPRKTQFCSKIWTHSIYNSDIPPKITNCTSMMSKIPRFPYEAFSEKDLEGLICRCGLQTCECPVEGEEEEEITCQARVPKRLYIGPAPRSKRTGGLSAPSKRDRGFEIYSDGSQKRIVEFPKADCPPFYETRVKESTAFYQGCKWSKWKSNREVKSLESRPGPADYQHKRESSEYERCAQKVRFLRRKMSKQCRFLEMLQRINILEGRPGPGSYDPREPKGTEIQSYGPKAKRFPVSEYDTRPDPATYSLKRDFDLPKPLEYHCQAKLPEPACFGIKAERFKPRRDEGPGPATYCPTYKPCQFMKCGAANAPFGSSSVRFKPLAYEDEDSDEFTDIEVEDSKQDKTCPPLTWEFKSQTIRMNPLRKNFNEPSPADKAMTSRIVDREPILHYLTPFNSSLGRFQPWHDWWPVHGTLKTPGPGYYCLEKPKCQPAVNHGPLYRAQRFLDSRTLTPAPNQYNVDGGVDTVLDTHNKRLTTNKKNKHKFTWKNPKDIEQKTIKRKELDLFDKCIALCDETDDDKKNKEVLEPVEKESAPPKDIVKCKLLRCFLYNKSMPTYY